jgi:hypothetical protein
MPCVSGDFGKGFEHKASLVHGRVRYDQAPGLNHGISKQQNVDVDVARAFLLLAPAAHFLLDGQHPVDQLPGRFLRVQLERAIQKPGLRSEFDRLGFVKRRDRRYFTQTAQVVDRRSQIPGAVTNI